MRPRSPLFRATSGSRQGVLANTWIELRRLCLLLWIGGGAGADLLLRKLLRRPVDRAGLGLRLRRFCERMGLTYVKLGQFLASRFDLLPPEVCRELENLFEVVTPVRFEAIRAVIEAELGMPLDMLYGSFEEPSMAAGSVAQVHRATTRGGERVAVKVQRPGIEERFRADIRILRRLARVLDWTGSLRRLSAVDWVDEFEAFTLRELDFISEGRTADRLRRQAASYEYIPRVFWEQTSRRVLTLELIEGVSVARVCQLIASGQEDTLARLLPHTSVAECMRHFSNASMRQLFVMGFFHGDPHPGNVFFLADGTVAFLDFGIFGALTPSERRTLAAMVENLALGRVEASFHSYSQLSTPTSRTDRQVFRRETLKVMRAWHRASADPASSVSARHMGKYFGEMLEIFRVQHRRMEADQLLFWRALLTLDSTALRLASHFDLLQAMQEFFQARRPGPASRLAEALEDPERFLAQCDLVAMLPDLTRRLRAPAAEHGPALPLVEERGARDELRALRPLLLGTAALTAMLGAASVQEGPLGDVLAGLGAALLLASALAAA